MKDTTKLIIELIGGDIDIAFRLRKKREIETGKQITTAEAIREFLRNADKENFEDQEG